METDTKVDANGALDVSTPVKADSKEDSSAELPKENGLLHDGTASVEDLLQQNNHLNGSSMEEANVEPVPTIDMVILIPFLYDISPITSSNISYLVAISSTSIVHFKSFTDTRS